MDKAQLQKIFSNAYKHEDWLEVLKSVFGAKQLLMQPKPISLASNDITEGAFELGNITTTDDRIIGLYKIEVKPNIFLERNKVGLRKLLRDVYKYDVDGALIVFVQENKWRLSFVSEVKVLNDEGEVVTEITEPKRYTYLLGEGEKVQTPAIFLSKLASKIYSLEDIRKAFSVDILNEEFYKVIQQKFYELVGGKIGSAKKTADYGTGKLILPGITNEARQIHQEFGVRLIGRTVFCWFLKMKKAENIEPLISHELLSSKAVKDNKGYYHTILERLFFQTLNTPMDERIENLPKGCEKVPFLNGGLFEPGNDDYYRFNKVTGLSENINTLKITDDWFQSFFEELEKYNFTIDENSVTDVEVSVDPEMLGRIFENLLAEIDPDSGETARKATGSFYTPREIVDYMAIESLVQYIHNKTSIDQIRLRYVFRMSEKAELNFNDSERIDILKALDTVKILDPACGSGAFPMGVLQKIVVALQKLDKNAEWWIQQRIKENKNGTARKAVKEKLEGNSQYARKIGIIQNSLYGVDIQPIAAEISKLRCFLTLVVDERIDDSKPNRGIDPLPNLEFKFVTANTLLNLPDQNIRGGLFDHFEELEELEQLRIDYLQSSGKEKQKIKERFPIVQRKIFKEQMNLFVDTESRAYKLSTWDPFGHEKADWFEPKWMYGVEKFDIVIGNPPYVEHKKLKNIASKLKPLYDVYTGSSDLSVYFFERGFDLLNENGVISYISTNKFFNTGYGKTLRSYLTKKKINRVINFEQVEVFKGVLVSSVIFQAENRPNFGIEEFEYFEFHNESNWKESFTNYLHLRKALYSQDSLSDAEWVFLKGNEGEIKLQIEKNRTFLKDLDGVEIKRGLTTGYDPAFIIDLETKERLGNAEIIKPLILGRDIKKYIVEEKERFIINSHNGLKGKIKKVELENQYPLIFQFLLEKDFESGYKLSTRTDTGDHWTNLRSCAFLDLFDMEKIVWPLTADQWGYALDRNQNYLTSGGFFLVSKSISIKTLLAILNSKVLAYYFKFIGVMTAGGAYTLKKSTIEMLPIAIPENSVQLDILVEYLIHLKSLKSQEIRMKLKEAYFEEIINGIVYETYFPDLLKKFNREISINIGELKPILNKMSSEEKDKIIDLEFNRLDDKTHPVRNNLYYLKSIEEIATIEGLKN